MARSRWKLAYFSKKVWRLIFKIKAKKIKARKWKKPMFLIYSRQSSIPACFKGVRVKIYKGNAWRLLSLKLQHSFYKFGEYSFTRKLYYYPLKKKKRR